MPPTFTATRYPALAPSDATLVYIDAGQSNSDGINGRFDTWLNGYTFSRVQVFWKGGNNQESSANDGVFQTAFVGPGDDSNLQNRGFRRTNSAMYTLRHLERTYPNPIRVIKVSEGSTGFESGAGKWANGGALDVAFRNYHLAVALPQISNPHLLPIYWNQGERDAGQLTDANNYAAQLTAFITRVRAVIGIPDFPWVLTRLSNTLGFPQRAIVQAAQDAVAAADPDIHLINTNDIPFLSDNIHYAQDGFEQVALRYLQLAHEMGATAWEQ